MAGGYQAPPPELTVGVAPQVGGGDGVEAPRRLAGLGIERVDDAPVTAGVDAADADRDRADEDLPAVDGRLDVDARGRGVGDVARPDLCSRRRVERDHALRAAHAEHAPVGHGHAERSDVEPGGLAHPPGHARVAVEGADGAAAVLHVDGVADDEGHGRQRPREIVAPGHLQSTDVGRRRWTTMPAACCRSRDRGAPSHRGSRRPRPVPPRGRPWSSSRPPTRRRRHRCNRLLRWSRPRRARVRSHAPPLAAHGRPVGGRTPLSVQSSPTPAVQTGTSWRSSPGVASPGRRVGLTHRGGRVRGWLR